MEGRKKSGSRAVAIPAVAAIHLVLSMWTEPTKPTDQRRRTLQYKLLCHWTGIPKASANAKDVGWDP